MKIVVDPGHGGKWNNAKGANSIEKNVVLEYAGYLAGSLRRQGHECLLTRSGDNHLSEVLDNDLSRRAAIANEFKADLFISLHCNGFDDPRVNGFEVFTSVGETRSDSLADLIIEEVQNSFPMAKYRKDTTDGDNDKEADFVVLKETMMPAVLIELGFLTNREEELRITGNWNIMEYCESITRAVVRWGG